MSLVEDLLVIWFDPSLENRENEEDIARTKLLLRQMNTYVLFFSNHEACFEYLRSVGREKVILITSGSAASIHMAELHAFEHIESIFIFCVQQERYLPLKEKYWKLTGVLVEQEELINALISAIEFLTRQATIFALFDGKQRSTRYLTRESAGFLWFQLLTHVLKNITSNEKKPSAIEEMLEYCELYYRANRLEITQIKEFRETYVSV